MCAAAEDSNVENKSGKDLGTTAIYAQMGTGSLWRFDVFSGTEESPTPTLMKTSH